MKLILIALLIMASCSKQESQPSNSAFCISWKCSADTTLLRVDTLWRGYKLGPVDIAKIEAQKVQWLTFCTPPLVNLPNFILEKIYYTYNP